MRTRDKGIGTSKYVRKKVPFCVYVPIFSYARYFHRTMEGVGSTFCYSILVRTYELNDPDKEELLQKASFEIGFQESQKQNGRQTVFVPALRG